MAPATTAGVVGATAMEDRVGAAGVTVRAAVPLTPLREAVMVVGPPATAVARPAVMVATLVAELLHATVAVTFCVDPLL